MYVRGCRVACSAPRPPTARRPASSLLGPTSPQAMGGPTSVGLQTPMLPVMVKLRGATAAAHFFVLDLWIARMPGTLLLPGYLKFVIGVRGGFRTQKAFVQGLPVTVCTMRVSLWAARPTGTSRMSSSSLLRRQLHRRHSQCAAESVASQPRQCPAAARVPPPKVPDKLPALTTWPRPLRNAHCLREWRRPATAS